MSQRPLKAGRRPLKERTRRPDDAPTFAVSTPVKLEILIALHEGEFTAGEIAERIDEDVKHVTNHLRRLYDAGCIEFVGHRVEGNFRKPVYRAVVRPLVTDETYRSMSTEERHDATGVVLQWILAECLSSYRNGKMDHDENLCLISDEPILDLEAKQELRKFLAATWSGKREEEEEGSDMYAESVLDIECRAINRMAKSNESGTTMVVALLAFERGRSGTSAKARRLQLHQK